MNFWGNSRKLYLIASAMVVTAVVLLTFGSAWGKPAGQAADSSAVSPAVTLSPAATAVPGAEPTPGLSAAVETKKMTTVVYYQDDSGYLVPVMRSVPMQQGVAGATLSLMVKNEQNDMDAARLGLRTVLPEGCEFEIDINGDGVFLLAELGISSHLYRMLPYLITLIVLAFTSKSSRAPKAEGIPYDKGSR